jgi:hypothetical protein
MGVREDGRRSNHLGGATDRVATQVVRSMQWQVMGKHKGTCGSMAARLPYTDCMGARLPAASTPVRLNA